MGILDPPSLTRQTAKSIFAPRAAQTMVVIGDSLTEQGGDITANPDIRSFSAWTFGNVQLGQAFSILANLGVGGETIAQIKARAPSAVALNPGWVHLLCGTNTVGTAGFSTAGADITSMLDTFEAAGIRVVLGTIPPRGGGTYTGTQLADTLALNEWLRGQARARPGIVVVDYFTALADGVSSNYRALIAGFNPTSDSTHLSATGGWACGNALALALSPYVTPSVPYSTPTPGANLLSRSRPAEGSTTAAPLGWSWSGTGLASAAWSNVVRADGPLGEAKQVTIGTGLAMTGNVNTVAVDGSRLAVGDVLNAVVEFDVTDMEQAAAIDAQGIALSLRSWNGSAYASSIYAFNYFRGPNTNRAGVLRTPNFTVPTSTTLVSLFLELRGGMTFRFDLAGVYNRKTYPV